MDELKELLEYLSAESGIGPIRLVFKDVRRGCAHFRDRWISIPLWIFNHPIEYQYYYLIHEFCHFLTIGHGHNRTFKYTEAQWLVKFGLYPNYGRRRYPINIRNAAGEILWGC